MRSSPVYCVYLVIVEQPCVNEEQTVTVCVDLDQSWVDVDQSCVDLDQYCVDLDQYCVDVDQYCVQYCRAAPCR